MQDLDKTLDTLFSAADLTDESKDKLKEEFKEKLLLFLVNYISVKLPKAKAEKFTQLLGQNDKTSFQAYIESNSSIKNILDEFWSERAPVIVKDYKEQVLDPKQ